MERSPAAVPRMKIRSHQSLSSPGHVHCNNPTLWLYVMPTVLRCGGFAVRIHLPPREHAPAQVHVHRRDAEVVITISGGNDPPSIRAIHGMSDRDVLRAYRIVEGSSGRLFELWRGYHDEATE